MFSTIKYNGIRWQQAPYFSAVTYSACAIVSAALISRFNDIDFTGPYLSQYRQLKANAPLQIETNVALLAFAVILWTVDLFRKTPFPVWFEMSWSFVFGLLEIGNVIMASRSYPSAHCTLTPAVTVLANGTVGLSKRDSPTVAGTILELTPQAQQKMIVAAAQDVCGNWNAEFVFFAICAIMLLCSHFGWLAFVALRHRRSHPDYIMEPIPVPFVWDLPTESATSRPSDVETASIASTAVGSADSYDEKKTAFDAVPTPAPVMVHLKHSA